MLCLIDPDAQIPRDHPIRDIKRLADAALKRLSPTFDEMYATRGRPSVPPERLLKGMILMALYSIPSELRLCEQIRYNLMFRWFLDMSLTEAPFDHCAFSDNRERLMRHEVAQKFFVEVVQFARDAELMSSDHFSVDGTLIEAWASMKSFRPREEGDDGDSNGWADFRGSKRSNATHVSRTDPESKLMRKGLGKEARLSFAAHALMENRNGLLVDFRVSEATGTCETDAALEMLADLPRARRRRTVGADKAYDHRRFVEGCRSNGITPHVAQRQRRVARSRGSAIDRRSTRHAGYTASQVVRKRIEQIFGWTKAVAGLRRTRFRGVARTQLLATVTGSAYNLLRIARLLRQPA